MANEEKLYRAIKVRSNFIFKKGIEWRKEISSAKNYVCTPDFKFWTFGKSVGLNGEYHNHGGVAKKWLYSMGFFDALKLPNGNFRRKTIQSFLDWATKVEAFDIIAKFKKDQKTNKRFEILVHYSVLPSSLLKKTNISTSNQNFFNEGFKKEITREVAVRDRKVIELAKIKWGTKCIACNFDFGVTYGMHGKNFIEMHHLHPIALGVRQTTVDSIRPICSNCHRMLHKGERLLSIKELKQIIKKAKTKS